MDDYQISGYVSHDMFAVENMFNRAYPLDHGRRVTEGKPTEVDGLALLPSEFYLTASITDREVFVTYGWYKCLSFSVYESDVVKERVGVLCLDSRWCVLRT